MKVFVAGASGVIGRRLLPMLRDAGHEVTAMTRSERKAPDLQAAGASPVICDAFDAPAVRQAVRAAAPDAVIHQLTDIPPALDARKVGEQMATNDRLRREGTRNLLDAARAAGVRRMVAQSIAFAYEPSGPKVVDEDHPLYLDAPGAWRRSVQAIAELERSVVEDVPEGIVLRYGFFYGPGTAYERDGHWAKEVRRRRFPQVGKGEGVFSFVHVDDAASATVAALSRGASGVYNVVDDEPAPISEWLPAYASALGAPKPRRVPKWLARLAGGSYATMMATELRGALNERAKRELGWAPRHANWRTGSAGPLGLLDETALRTSRLGPRRP